MKASAHFEAESVTKTKMGNRVPSDFGFLKPLIDFALDKSDTIRIGCFIEADPISISEIRNKAALRIFAYITGIT